MGKLGKTKTNPNVFFNSQITDIVYGWKPYRIILKNSNIFSFDFTTGENNFDENRVIVLNRLFKHKEWQRLAEQPCSQTRIMQF